MGLTHFDEEGKVVMVDVTNKEDTVREAAATGKIQVSPEVYTRRSGPERWARATCWAWRPRRGLWGPSGLRS